jgi:hypothetical protein
MLARATEIQKQGARNHLAFFEQKTATMKLKKGIYLIPFLLFPDYAAITTGYFGGDRSMEEIKKQRGLSDKKVAKRAAQKKRQLQNQKQVLFVLWNT